MLIQITLFENMYQNMSLIMKKKEEKDKKGTNNKFKKEKTSWQN